MAVKYITGLLHGPKALMKIAGVIHWYRAQESRSSSFPITLRLKVNTAIKHCYPASPRLSLT